MLQLTHWRQMFSCFEFLRKKKQFVLLGGSLSEQRLGPQASRSDHRRPERGHFQILLFMFQALNGKGKWRERYSAPCLTPTHKLLSARALALCTRDLKDLTFFPFSKLPLSGDMRCWLLPLPKIHNQKTDLNFLTSTLSANLNMFQVSFSGDQTPAPLPLLFLTQCTAVFSQGRQESSVHSSTTTEHLRFSKASGLQSSSITPGKGISFPIESVLVMPYRVMLIPFPSLYTRI